jgi:hypothetical protein
MCDAMKKETLMYFAVDIDGTIADANIPLRAFSAPDYGVVDVDFPRLAILL